MILLYFLIVIVIFTYLIGIKNILLFLLKFKLYCIKYYRNKKNDKSNRIKSNINNSIIITKSEMHYTKQMFPYLKKNGLKKRAVTLKKRGIFDSLNINKYYWYYYIFYKKNNGFIFL